MRDFRKYEVWQLSHQLTLNVYKISRNFPKEEIFGLLLKLEEVLLLLDIIFLKEVVEILIKNLLILSILH